MKSMSKAEALEAFKKLLESEGIEEVEVQKVYIDKNNAHKREVVVRVVLKK